MIQTIDNLFTYFSDVILTWSIHWDWTKVEIGATSVNHQISWVFFSWFRFCILQFSFNIVGSIWLIDKTELRKTFSFQMTIWLLLADHTRHFATEKDRRQRANLSHPKWCWRVDIGGGCDYGHLNVPGKCFAGPLPVCFLPPTSLIWTPSTRT